jgi:hypothetical protein
MACFRVNPISLSELRVSIVRDRRLKRFWPPQTVLREFCLQAPGLHVHEDTIEAKPRIKPDEVLSQLERCLVRILSQHGGAMAVSELKSACLRTGLDRTTCYLYLVNSPITSNCGYHRYGLIGSSENLGKRGYQSNSGGTAPHPAI